MISVGELIIFVTYVTMLMRHGQGWLKPRLATPLQLVAMHILRTLYILLNKGT